MTLPGDSCSLIRIDSGISTDEFKLVINETMSSTVL